MKRLSKILAMLLCLSILLTACSSGTTNDSSTAGSTTSGASSSGDGSNAGTTSSKADKSTLVYACTTEPGKLDPQGNGIIHGMMIEKQIYDPLITKDPATGEFVGRLATEWEWVDETHLSLTLREGVKWHDGSDFTAADVLFTLSRFPDGASTGSLYTAFDPENSTSDGDYQVTIAFKQPFAPALNFLTNPRAFIVSKAYCDANGEEILDRAPMGTGAYVFEEWLVGTSVSLTRNDNYWDTPAAIPNIQVRFIADDNARMIALETGEVDIASEIQDSDVSRALAEEIDGVIGYAIPSFKVWNFAFNTVSGDTAEIFQKKEVRLAIAHAVDWEATITTAAGSVAVPAKSSLASTISFYKEVGIYEYDPELSKQLLADAGYADGFEFTVVEEEVPLAVRVLETIQAYLAEIGITMDIEVTDTPTWQEATQNGTAQATIANMTANTGDPTHTLNGYVATSASVANRVMDEKFNQLFNDGIAEQDEAKRQEIYEELQDYIYENAFFIPMWEQVITYGVRDYVQGFIPDSGIQPEIRYLSFS